MSSKSSSSGVTSDNLLSAFTTVSSAALCSSADIPLIVYRSLLGSGEELSELRDDGRFGMPVVSDMVGRLGSGGVKVKKRSFT